MWPAGRVSCWASYLPTAPQVTAPWSGGASCHCCSCSRYSTFGKQNILHFSIQKQQFCIWSFLQERGLDVGAQASWLASSFNQTAKEFYSKTTEVSRKLALWEPLSSYLEGVAEVFETSTNLNLSQEKLLNEGFDWLLPACRVSELNSALSFLQVVLAQLR